MKSGLKLVCDAFSAFSLSNFEKKCYQNSLAGCLHRDDKTFRINLTKKKKGASKEHK